MLAHPNFLFVSFVSLLTTTRGISWHRCHQPMTSDQIDAIVFQTFFVIQGHFISLKSDPRKDSYLLIVNSSCHGYQRTMLRSVRLCCIDRCSSLGQLLYSHCSHGIYNRNTCVPLKYKRTRWSGNLITQKHHELRKLQYRSILPADLSVLFPKSYNSQSLQSHSTDPPNLWKEKLGLWHLSCVLDLSSIPDRPELRNDPYQPDLSNFPGPI